MPIRIICEHPFARDKDGQLKTRIATLFLGRNDLVTIPGIHATQRMAYCDFLDAERQRSGLPPLTEEERRREFEKAVDLIVEDSRILIRPDPEHMDLAFQADEALQEFLSKRKIRFLQATDTKVRQAIRERGEYWRISPLPQTPEQMKAMIAQARIRIACLPIYYYNTFTGTRYLTYQQFAELAALDVQLLARQLDEIQKFSQLRNRRGYPELDFFLTDSVFGADDFRPYDFLKLDEARLRNAHRELSQRFAAAVPEELRLDDPDNPEWRKQMMAALIGGKGANVAEEILEGLSPEFFLQIRWLPAGRIEEGELIFDSIFDEAETNPQDGELTALCDQNAKNLFFNFIREFGDVEYTNIGRIVTSLSDRPAAGGRRDVYIAEIKLAEVEKPVVRVIRLLKWGIREHLEENKDLLRAIIEAEEYADYILDRRLGCRQLGMNLPSRIAIQRVGEVYHGIRKEYEGQMIWAMYVERDYIAGVATDKLPLWRFRNPEFALKFAQLLGRAAAPNMIVGRLHQNGTVLFDDGDEVLVMDSSGLPTNLVVADHTGTFVNYTTPLEAFADGYAVPINRRIGYVPDPAVFVESYCGAFLQRFLQIQREYVRRRRAFRTLFKHRKYDTAGSFAHRWSCVLDRLEQTDAVALVQAIRRHIALPVTARSGSFSSQPPQTNI
mgnify:CR=1 FL=1